MQITYDTKADAIYIKFCDGEFIDNKEVEEGIIIDMGKENVVLGIEILEASSRFQPEDLADVEFDIVDDRTLEHTKRLIHATRGKLHR